jgi:hypothetical protein
MDELVLIAEEKMVRAVLVAKDAAAVVEGILAANVLEADRALVQLSLGFRFLARQADDGFGHGSLLRS